MEMMTVIENRHSVRQYTNQKIEEDKREKLQLLCDQINAENEMKIQMIYDEPRCFNSMMAHYGKFSGVQNYIAIVGPKSSQLEEKAGYYGEQLVLKAQELGLNTCWVALTHGKSMAVIQKGEKQVILIAMGYGQTQGKVHRNKSIDAIAQINAESPQWYQDGVKAALMAPTAVNQQKFWIEQAGDNARITTSGGMLTQLDLGIVKYHFEVVSGHKTVS